MRQRVFTFLALFLLVFALVGLNAVSYVKKNIEPDSESEPNRSTFNAGATGARALYDLLAETGRNPYRWQEDFSALDKNSKIEPKTFVVIGALKKSYSDTEVEQMLRWVSFGRKLVVIDRAPEERLIATTANWKISVVAPPVYPGFNTDPSDQKQMTSNIAAQNPVQPTLLTKDVNAVHSSRFAASIALEKLSVDGNFAAPVQNDADADDEPPPKSVLPANNNSMSGKSSPPSVADQSAKLPTVETAAQRAPVVHLADREGKILLADFPYGSGEIVFLTDPYIVSNAGINLADNMQLALNIADADGGTIAFDEYHQGFVEQQNQFFSYFAGTPVIAIGIQLILLLGLFFFTQSRRFARPLPATEPSRLSKLEYVAAMAELQQRTKAYDLAIENIYTDFRRRAARALGASNYEITRPELAARIAARLKLDAGDIENLMRTAEEIIYGEPTNKRQVLDVITSLRKLEERLNLKRTRQQSFEKKSV